MNILTGQIDLNALQQNVGIGLDKLTEFVNGTAVGAIENYITYKIVAISIVTLIVLTIYISTMLFIRKLYKENKDDMENEDIVPYIMFPIIISIPIIPFIIVGITGILSRSIAPEITFIQSFMQ